MRLTFFICLIFCMTSAGNVLSQQKISMKLGETTLKTALLEFQKQTNRLVIYSDDKIESSRRVKVDFADVEIEEFLRELLKGSDMTFRLMEDYVVITNKEARPQQGARISGKVTDEKKNPLAGVTILIKGTFMGTVTDKNGKFEITLPDVKAENLSLLFTFVGMKSVEVKYVGEHVINVVMKENAADINEVVVTGYQEIREKSMAGTYSRIKGEDLGYTGNETVEQLLQGRLPGVMVINESGLTGTRQKVRVRGTSTLVGNADPVWVVDGIIQEDNLPFETTALASLGDNVDMMKDFIGGAISWLNPSDIDEITVLKDASATAIYGVKAANGVILITTKKGEQGRMTLSYSTNLSLSNRLNYNRMEVMNSKERVALSREAFERGARIHNETIGYAGFALAYSREEISLDEFHQGVKHLETVNSDWFDLLYQTPFSQSHTISFSGGSAQTTYRASFGFRDQQNTAKGNDQTSYTANLNLSSVFWDRLSLNASLSGSYAKTNAFAAGVDPYNYAINTSRVIACYEDNELFYYERDGYNYNILNELANSGNRNTTQSLNLGLSARCFVTDALTLSLTLGGSTSNSFAESWFTERSHEITKKRGYEYGEYGVLDDQYKASLLPYGGMLVTNESRNFNYTARLQAEYVKLFNGVHSLNLMVGGELRSNKYDGYSQTNYGYQPDRGKSFVDVPIVTPDGTINNLYVRSNPTVADRLANYVSYYATGGYMYDNRYSVNLSVRGDASNRFGSDARFEPVWSAGFRWNVTDEVWMDHQNLVNNLALTATFGYQGNVAENISPDFIAKLQSVNATTGEYRMTWSQLPNPNLKWEKTMSVNLGAHFSFFQSKINGNFNWYYKKTTDVITSREVPFEAGTNSMYVNDGDVTNKGWDLAFNLVPVRTKDFMWSLGTSFSGNTNEVNSQIATTGSWTEAASGKMNKKGYPVGSFWAFRYTGLNPENGAPLFDLSRAGTSRAAEDASEFMAHVGTREPTLTFGLNMVFRWKGFTLPLNLYFSHGNHEFLASPYENGYSMMSEARNASTELNDRWRKPGDEKYTDIPSIPVGNNCRRFFPFEDRSEGLYPLEAWQYSDIRVVKAWYIRMNDLQLSYNLPEKWIAGFARHISVSFSTTNPLVIRSKDFKGRDPEVALGNQPRSQNFSLGINMNF